MKKFINFCILFVFLTGGAFAQNMGLGVAKKVDFSSQKKVMPKPKNMSTALEIYLFEDFQNVDDGLGSAWALENSSGFVYTGTNTLCGWCYDPEAGVYLLDSWTERPTGWNSLRTGYFTVNTHGELLFKMLIDYACWTDNYDRNLQVRVCEEGGEWETVWAMREDGEAIPATRKNTFYVGKSLGSKYNGKTISMEIRCYNDAYDQTPFGLTIDDVLFASYDAGIESGGLVLDAVNFPDSVFRKYLIQNFDVDQNGFLNDIEKECVVGIDVSNTEVTSLKGIELFEGLLALNCDNTPIERLDVTSSRELKYLWCNNTRIDNMDLSKNLDLLFLECGNTPIRNLNVRPNSKLLQLYINNTDIYNLDLSRNTDLWSLNCVGSQITDLDLSNNHDLYYLRCSDMPLERLNLKGSGELRRLYCSNTYLTDLDLSDCSLLRTFDYGNMGRTVSNKDFLDPIQGVLDLGIFPNMNLYRISDVSGGYLQGKELTFYGQKVTYYYDTRRPENEYNTSRYMRVSLTRQMATVPINVKNFPDPVFRACVKDYFDFDGNDSLSSNERFAVIGISLGGYEDQDTVIMSPVQNLKGVELFPALQELYVQNSALSQLDISQNSQLTRLDCYNTSLRVLDISKNASLKYLDCHKTRIKKLEAAANSMLNHLNCSQGILVELKISTAYNLEYLYCDHTDLLDLEVPAKHYMEVLMCNHTHLASLNLNNNYSYLRELRADSSIREIRAEKGDTINLNTLPGFNYEYAYDWQGATVEDSLLVFVDSIVTYKYDVVRNEDVRYHVEFTLVANPNAEEYTTDPELEDISIDRKHFPNKVFCNYVKENFDEDGDGWLNSKERYAVESVVLSDTALTTLSGIEYFPELKELRCSKSALTSLDLSGNPKLTSENFECKGSVCKVEIEKDGSFDLSTLPKFIFQNASGWDGGEVDDYTLVFKGDEVSYRYATLYSGEDESMPKKLTFTLVGVKKGEPEPEPEEPTAVDRQDGVADFQVYVKDYVLFVKGTHGLVEVFDIQGRRVLCGENNNFILPQQGIYIVRNQGKSKKVVCL